ncbi:unnamed protein product [Orchesella dallaii]|uniref:Uncharacterized protein n=1 Tax=Orchesella dallaii TaxID=48710 RepID=A0ABP1PXR7_9HEXA
MIPMSSKHLAYHMGFQLTGNESLHEADLQELCLRVNRKGIISYHDVKTTLFSCNYTWSKPVHCYSTESKPHPHAVGTITITLVWMDDTSRHLLLVLCASEAKQKYWLLASNEAVIDSKIKTKVLNTISGLGFDRKTVLYHDHSKCTEVEFKNKTSKKMQFLLLLLTLGVLACADKQAYHDKITEGPCKSRYPWGKGVDFLDVAHRNWWVLMTSKHLAYHLGLQFLGNDSLSESQFQKLCLRFNDDGIFSLLDPDNILLECNMQGNAMFWMSCHFPDSRLPALVKMAQNKASSLEVEESGISDDPCAHEPECNYYQYKQVHSKGLRSEEQVKLRLKDDLLRKRGRTRTQPAVVVEVEKEVDEAMCESGIVFQYLKTKREVYDSYKPLMKSFCSCKTAKISKIEQSIKGDEMVKVPERHFAVDEIRESAEGCLPVDQIHFALERPVAIELMQSLYGEKKKATLFDESDDSSVAPQPKETPATTSARHVYSQVQLNSREQAGLELPEDESDEESDAAAAVVLPPSVVGKNTEIVNTGNPGEQGKGSENCKSDLKSVCEYLLKKNLELGHQATRSDESDDSSVAPQPKETQTHSPVFAKCVYSRVLTYRQVLNSLQQTGPELSEDESDEESEAAAVAVVPL